MPFIYETYDTVSRSGFKDFKEYLPDYITKNLKYRLRPYQQEAMGRYLYYKNDENRAIPEQVLYNMATWKNTSKASGTSSSSLITTIFLPKLRIISWKVLLINTSLRIKLSWTG